jgi:hypothetical protein
MQVELVSDRMWYIILRSHWFDINFLNVCALTEVKIDDVKDSSYKELEWVFDKFSKYRMQILLEFGVKAGGEDIFKPTVGNQNYTKLVMTTEF